VTIKELLAKNDVDGSVRDKISGRARRTERSLWKDIICSTNGEKRNACRNWWERKKERDHLEG
jgi:hypothetical protein